MLVISGTVIFNISIIPKVANIQILLCYFFTYYFVIIILPLSWPHKHRKLLTSYCVIWNYLADRVSERLRLQEFFSWIRLWHWLRLQLRLRNPASSSVFLECSCYKLERIKIHMFSQETYFNSASASTVHCSVQCTANHRESTLE